MKVDWTYILIIFLALLGKIKEGDKNLSLWIVIGEIAVWQSPPSSLLANTTTTQKLRVSVENRGSNFVQISTDINFATYKAMSPGEVFILTLAESTTLYARCLSIFPSNVFIRFQPI